MFVRGFFCLIFILLQNSFGLTYLSLRYSITDILDLFFLYVNRQAAENSLTISCEDCYRPLSVMTSSCMPCWRNGYPVVKASVILLNLGISTKC